MPDTSSQRVRRVKNNLIRFLKKVCPLFFCLIRQPTCRFRQKPQKKTVSYAIKLTDASNVMTDSASKKSLSVIFLPNPSAYMPHPAKTKKKNVSHAIKLTDASNVMTDSSLFDPTWPQKYAWHVTKNTVPAFISRPRSCICLVYVVYSLSAMNLNGWQVKSSAQPGFFVTSPSRLCIVSCVVCVVCLVLCVLCVLCGLCVLFPVSCV